MPANKAVGWVQSVITLRDSPLNSQMLILQKQINIYFCFQKKRQITPSQLHGGRLVSSTAGSYEAERRKDLSLKDTKLCNILINIQAFMNSPMTHAESRWCAY